MYPLIASVKEAKGLAVPDGTDHIVRLYRAQLVSAGILVLRAPGAYTFVTRTEDLKKNHSQLIRSIQEDITKLQETEISVTFLSLDELSTDSGDVLASSVLTSKQTCFPEQADLFQNFHAQIEASLFTRPELTVRVNQMLESTLQRRREI